MSLAMDRVPVVIALVPAFEEEGNIGACVRSALGGGCDRVVVLDGAYAPPNEGEQPFAGGGPRSRDHTESEAVAAGAEFIVLEQCLPFGAKRGALLELCGASVGDHVLFLDADERLRGTLPARLPDAAHLMLRNLKPNDLPGLRGEFPHGDAGSTPFPLLRLFRWSPELRFSDIGRVELHGKPIKAYYPNAKPAKPVLETCYIEHVHEATLERAAEKRRFYEARIKAWRK